MDFVLWGIRWNRLMWWLTGQTMVAQRRLPTQFMSKLLDLLRSFNLMSCLACSVVWNLACSSFLLGCQDLLFSGNDCCFVSVSNWCSLPSIGRKLYTILQQSLIVCKQFILLFTADIELADVNLGRDCVRWVFVPVTLYVLCLSPIVILQSKERRKSFETVREGHSTVFSLLQVVKHPVYFPQLLGPSALIISDKHSLTAKEVSPCRLVDTNLTVVGTSWMIFTFLLTDSLNPEAITFEFFLTFLILLSFYPDSITFRAAASSHLVLLHQLFDPVIRFAIEKLLCNQTNSFSN